MLVAMVLNPSQVGLFVPLSGAALRPDVEAR